MAIKELRIANFKGVADEVTFSIRPITLFIGPNSSGKSSALHALAALSQTVKLTGSPRPLVLDDEYAQVHLGRFIEVIHSKSYQDSMSIGIGIDRIGRGLAISKATPVVSANDPLTASYAFRSTRRTQDMYMERAEFALGGRNLSFRAERQGATYAARLDGKVVQLRVSGAVGLKMVVAPSFAGRRASDDVLEAYLLSQVLSEVVSEHLRKTLYLGPFRQSPQRRYPTRGSNPVEVGAVGESAVTMLANEYVQTKTRPHLKEVSQWLKKMGLAQSVDVSRVGKSDLFDVSMQLSDGASLPLADLGYGLSQVLPVLVQCSFAPKGSTLLFEQPELHLHPAAAQKLAGVFADVVNNKDVRLVAETHSKDLFLQLLRELQAGKIALDQIAAYEVERVGGRSLFNEIHIENNDGHIETYDPWDKGLIGM